MSTLEDDINNEYEDLKSVGRTLRIVEYATDFLFAGSAGMCLSYMVVNDLTYSSIFPTGYAAIMFCASILRGVEAHARRKQESQIKFLESVQIVRTEPQEEEFSKEFEFDKSGYEGWLNPNKREDW